MKIIFHMLGIDVDITEEYKEKISRALIDYVFTCFGLKHGVFRDKINEPLKRIMDGVNNKDEDYDISFDIPDISIYKGDKKIKVEI